MAENINPALRIRNIFDEAKKLHTNTTVEAWSRVFVLEDLDVNQQSFAISQNLHLLQTEIENLRDILNETNYSENLYSAYLDRCSYIVRLQTITSNWESQRVAITDDIILCLSFFSEILPSDEVDISEETLTEIESAMETLSEKLENTELPSFTLNIVRKHLEKIRVALSTYKIKGAEVFSEVLQSAYGEVIDNSGSFEESKDTEEVALLASTWQKIKQASNSAILLEKGASATGKLAERADKALELIDSILK